MRNISFVQNCYTTHKSGETFELSLKFIKKTIKKKIAIYEPLTLNYAFPEFLKKIRDDGYCQLETISENISYEEHIERLIKDFLIERTYFHLLFEEEDLILKFVTDILKKNGIPLNLNEEITVFVREKLEDKRKLFQIKKNFKEASKLKTYFYAITRNAVMDYQRKYNVIVDLQDSLTLDKIKSPSPSPHCFPEEKEIKDRVDRLATLEKIAFKMYYYEEITNFNAIARTLNTSRHKAKKILERAVDIVLKGEV